MPFKLGSENRSIKYGAKKNNYSTDDASVPGVPVIRKKLEGGIKAEANIDGSIFLDESVVPGSDDERAILMHEMGHINDMKVGKLSYTDDDITWMGESFKREKGQIEYKGQWLPEGDKTFPWEQH